MGLSFGFWVWVCGFWVSDFGFRVSGFGFYVSGFGFRVLGFGFRVSVFRFRVQEADSGFGLRMVSRVQRGDLLLRILRRRLRVLHPLLLPLKPVIKNRAGGVNLGVGRAAGEGDVSRTRDVEVLGLALLGPEPQRHLPGEHRV